MSLANEPYETIYQSGRAIGEVVRVPMTGEWLAQYEHPNPWKSRQNGFRTRSEAIAWLKSQESMESRQTAAQPRRSVVPMSPPPAPVPPDMEQVFTTASVLIGIGAAIGAMLSSQAAPTPEPAPINVGPDPRQAEIDALREQNELLKQIIRQQSGSQQTGITKRK